MIRTMNNISFMLSNDYVKSIEKFFFIIDLFICSIWGLFMFSQWSFSLRAVLVPVLFVAMRIVLSFLVYKRVGYGLFSAVCFAVILLLYEDRNYVLTLPIIKMVDFPLLIFGGAELDSFASEFYYTPNKETGILIAKLGVAWLIGYPILFGLYSLLKIKENRNVFIPIWSDRTVKQYGLLALVIFTAFLIGRENPG